MYCTAVLAGECPWPWRRAASEARRRDMTRPPRTVRGTPKVQNPPESGPLGPVVGLSQARCVPMKCPNVLCPEHRHPTMILCAHPASTRPQRAARAMASEQTQSHRERKECGSDECGLRCEAPALVWPAAGGSYPLAQSYSPAQLTMTCWLLVSQVFSNVPGSTLGPVALAASAGRRLQQRARATRPRASQACKSAASGPPGDPRANGVPWSCRSNLVQHPLVPDIDEEAVRASPARCPLLAVQLRVCGALARVSLRMRGCTGRFMSHEQQGASGHAQTASARCKGTLEAAGGQGWRGGGAGAVCVSQRHLLAAEPRVRSQ